MTSMASQAPLVVIVLLFLATVKAEGGVTFWRTNFTMTCPQSGTFYDKNKKSLTEESTQALTMKYENDKKGPYHCKYGGGGGEDDQKEEIYYFFVQGKTCENCFELDATLFGVVIVMDVSLTAVVMTIIFMCTKKKNPAGVAHPPKTPARPGRQGPPVPSPDYEQLNAHTRSQDTYSIVNRTG